MIKNKIIILSAFVMMITSYANARDQIKIVARGSENFSVHYILLVTYYPDLDYPNCWHWLKQKSPLKR